MTALGPGICVAIPADMQKLSEVERLVNELAKKETALHVLVNNAGATWGESLDEYPVRTLFHPYRIHGAIKADTRMVLRAMKYRPSGKRVPDRQSVSWSPDLRPHPTRLGLFILELNTHAGNFTHRTLVPLSTG